MSVKIERDSNRKIVERDMEALCLGNLKTVEFDLELPDKGRYGSEIFWKSSHERFLTSDGKVSRPLYGMGNRKIMLTGLFSCGDIQMEKQYQVTVLEQENPYKTKASHPVTPMREPSQTGLVEKAQDCAKDEIRILPGNEFYDAQERMHRYLLGMEDDRMLYHFRKASGLDTCGADSPDGWDAEDCKLRGHTTGHYLSALALCYHATGDERIRDKAYYMVHELGKCQDAFSKMQGIREGFLSGYSEEQFDLLEQYTPYPEIWAPYYTLHKILAGLLDCYQYAKSQEALEIAGKLGAWVARRLGRLPRRSLKKMWGMYIAGEFGGMNAVMAQLAGITGREEFVRCAGLFDNDKLFEPLCRRQDMLESMHANQHIPQIIGALELYRATGRKRYLEIAGVFWSTVTKNRSYASGGVGEGEMFRGFREIGGALTANTQETCASYNMLKLTKGLFLFQPDARYMDYYEKTLLNHILASQAKDDSGESTYFFPLGPGVRREFLRENSCCHGTGMENPFRYWEGIYSKRAEDIYVNLFVPSGLLLKGRDGSILLRRISRREQSYRIQAKGTDVKALHIRKPDWADTWEILEGKKRLELTPDEEGYLVIAGDFSEEREIHIRWGQHFQLIRTPDEPEKTAVRYGPYLLAALSERSDFLQASFCEEDVAEKMKPEKGAGDKLHFFCDNWKWIPFYELEDEAYHAYVISKL